jgi:predicted RNA-binding protein with PIN domain
LPLPPNSISPRTFTSAAGPTSGSVAGLRSRASFRGRRLCPACCIRSSGPIRTCSSRRSASISRRTAIAPPRPSSQRILIVDGYNVINRIPKLQASLDGGLPNARNRLALEVANWGREHPGVECLIVFDGEFQGSGGREQKIAGIRCLFTLTRHGGDDEIIRFVREFKGRPRDITVVSDDNKVGNNCRAHGAAVRPSSFIMARQAGPPRPARTGRKGPAEGQGLDGKARAAIDAELRKKFGL